jgi:hypothetical protein
MKNIFVLSMTISFAMICSCQKQDSAAEQQLAQRKVELDAREDALIEREKVAEDREKALDKREKALVETQNARPNARTTSPDAQSQDAIRDPAQIQAERARSIEQIRAEMLAQMPDRSQMKVEKDSRTPERLTQKRPALEELQRQKQRVLEMSGAGVSSAVEAALPTPSPAPQ